VPGPGDHGRLSVPAAYGAFVMIGVTAGVGGVLLPAQMRDYGVDRTRIGITFFVFSAGFMVAGSVAGALVQRLGTRSALAVGTGTFTLSALYTATRPSFVGLVIVQVVLGFGCGVLESVLNTYLAGLPRAASRINRLHAFFGVGALLGPMLAAWMLRSWSWTSVWLVITVLMLLLVGVVLIVFPKPGVAVGEAVHRGLMAATAHDRAVVLGALFLAVYVGLEVSIGDWGYSFLVSGRGQSSLLAGYAVSGYWLGLTVGRFVISPAAWRIGLSEVGMLLGCLAAVVAATGLTWLASGPVSAVALFTVLGFFLGPIFPTTMAMTPRLTEERLVPTAIGLINGVSVVGGCVLPWLAGTITQAAGVTVLVPFCVLLAALLMVIWLRLARLVPGRRQEVSSAPDYMRRAESS
jgi:fucose permease